MRAADISFLYVRSSSVRTRLKTACHMERVSFPVLVFCRLG
jgi:hypothetical protein